MRFAAYQKRLYGYALALARDPDQAAEMVQDCVVRVMSSRQVPEDEPAYRSWLFTIVRNLWLDRQRRSKTHEHADLTEETEADATHPGGEDVVVNVIAVRQAFEQLPQHHRDILALVDVAGFGYRETAAILGLPDGTVMSRVSRGRALLCKLLSDGRVTQLPAGQRKTSS